MEEQSDTPRTDASERASIHSNRYTAVGWRLARDLERELATATRERDEAQAELETERLRLAACGVVAMANTPESAARVRDILPKHFSASLHSVMGAVDREMDLRVEIERLRALQAACIAWRGAREIPVPDGHRAALHASEQVYAALAATEAKP